MNYYNILSFRVIALVVVSIFFFLPSYAFAQVKAGPGCRCNGEVKTGNAKLGFTGTARIVNNQCIDNKNQPIATQADCDEIARTAFIQNEITEFSFVSCKLDTSCGSSVDKAEFQIRKPILNIFIPDLEFSDIETTIDEKGNIQIPWIGEYIVAIYRLLVNVASILGVILIIREGIRIILSAGGEEKVQGYQHIGRILIGLLLAWFSYVILFNLNSSLVSIRPLNVRVVADEITSESDSYDPSFDSDKDFDQVIKAYNDSSNTPRGGKPIGGNITACSWCAPGVTLDPVTFCSQWDARTVKPCGYAPEDSLAKFDTCDVILNGQSKTVQLMGKKSRTTVYANPAAKPAICKAVEIALNLGYEIRFSSVYRDFSTQAQNWCKKGSQGGLRAEPGCSVHGTGLAQDIYLFKDGKQLTSIDGDEQCRPAMAGDIKKLAEIMYAASPNFRRLEAEIWHFEYGGKDDACHIRTTAVPFCCNEDDNSCRTKPFATCGQGKRH